MPAVLRRKHAPVSISHGYRPDLPASEHASPICPQTSFKHSQKFVRVSCGYLHSSVIAKHQQEDRKVSSLLVYNPLKEIGWQWTCGHLAPPHVTCDHFASVLRTGKGLYTANLRVYDHFCGHGVEYTRIVRARYCLPADNSSAACDQVAGDL